jgi:hypothetical protein
MRSWVAVAVCASLTGCVVVKDGNDTGTSGSSEGSVQLDWRVGSAGCDASGVATVEVTIGSAVDQFTCGDQTGTMSVPAGTWEVTMRGLDADGVARYGADAGSVTVYGGQTTSVPTVLLSALPATLDVTWYFQNAHLCSANGVESVEIDLLDTDDTLQAQLVAPCDDAGASIADVEAGDYVVLLLGLDSSGIATYHGGFGSAVQPLGLERGDEVAVDIELQAY